MSDFPQRPVRVSTAIAARLRDSDGGQLDALVTNVSAHGCGLEATGLLEPGETIELLIDNRPPCAAQVRWTRGQRAGAQFTAGVDPL